MTDVSALIGELTVEEFVPVVLVALFAFIVIIGLLLTLFYFGYWVADQMLKRNMENRQRNIDIIKRECVDEVVRYYDEAYKRLEGDDDDGKSK